MIDTDGYRPNVGIIVSNRAGRVFWCKRVGQRAWQFPQGGIHCDETPLEAMFRELREETGLLPEHVRVEGCTRDWLRYRLPPRLIRRHVKPCCIGQKQIWYMLRLLGGEECVNLEESPKPEFDEWCWVDYWRPMHEVIFFKRHVYERALTELAPLVFDQVPKPSTPRRGYARRRRSR